MEKIMRASIIALLSAFATIGIVACAQDGEAAAEPVEQVAVMPVAHDGPELGESIPAAFSVRDSEGALRSFADLSGENGVVLVFNRSADWCSYCQAQMVQLQEIHEDLADRGYTLATLSYDTPTVLAEFAARENISYPMLSDEGSVVIDAFDLRDPNYSEDSFAYGVPRPAVFVIGADGRVRSKIVEANYRVRPATSDILAAVDAL
jgi:peroxiredoxin